MPRTNRGIVRGTFLLRQRSGEPGPQPDVGPSRGEMLRRSRFSSVVGWCLPSTGHVTPQLLQMNAIASIHPGYEFIGAAVWLVSDLGRVLTGPLKRSNLTLP